MKNSFRSLSQLAFLVFFALILTQCTVDKDSSTDKQGAYSLNVKQQITNGPFDKYWYQGLAEITSFDLQQARYGEIHPGHAVLVFVTEPFSKSKQVKLDNPQNNPKDEISVLKLNAMRKFNTGIYPYSTMQSVFTPMDPNQYPHTIKTTTSSQEWCGHTFQQLNLEKNDYRSTLNSYFESEGDEISKIKKALLEDEIWNRIRINPNTLPTGNIELIPSSLFTRLKHTATKVESAEASLVNNENNATEMQYIIRYKNLNRTLSIQFEKEFPHHILGWEENYTSGWGTNAKTLSTKATRKKTIQLDYWSKHNLADQKYRTELGLY